MALFLIKRLAGGILTLYVIATLCFVIIYFTPGSPLTGERNMPPEVLRNQERAWDLDKPLHVRYLRRMKGYLSGDFGMSFRYNRPVAELILPAVPKSFQLGSIAFFFAMLVGIPLGILAAARQNKLPDYISSSVALFGIILPNFLLGPILQMLLALWLHWLPVAGWPEDFSVDELLKVLLPAVTLAGVHIAYVSRLTRAGMLDVLHKDFIRTARSKGLDERSVFLKHALKNGVTPVLSYAGPMAAYIVTGSVVVEKVFNIPGMGQHFVDSALVRDQPVFMGAILIYSSLVIIFNILVDIGYSLLDPRVRLA
jgi:oligopeptide transport system permease protein